MLDKLSEAWLLFTKWTKSRARWFGYLLSLAAFVYLAGLLAYGGLQLHNIQWAGYGLPSLIALCLYLISLLVQFLIWARLLSSYHPIGWQDMAIYSRVLMLRRLPGGIWQWIGRTAMYADTTDIPANVIVRANFVEWIMLLLVAGGFTSLGLASIPGIVRWSLAVLLISLAVATGYSWQSWQTSWKARLFESVLWISLYGFAWLLGGVIIYLFGKVPPLNPEGPPLGLLQATWIWAITGGSGMLLVFVPAGLGIREFTLTWLLKPYLPPSGALVVAILLRFTFTLADFLWGTLGWGLSQHILRKRRNNLSSRV